MRPRQMAWMAALAILTVLAPFGHCADPASSLHTFAIGTNDFLMDGRRFQIRCGEIHAARIPREYWRNRLQTEVALQLDSTTAALEAQFATGSQMQEIKFEPPARGRFFCLESLSAFDGKPFAAVAELDLLDQSGKPLSHEGWTIAYVDSEERDKEDGTAENAIDGQTANYWHTEWGAAQHNHPHQLVIDLGASQTISGFRYVPRQGAGGGRIKNYRVYVGDNLVRK